MKKIFLALLIGCCIVCFGVPEAEARCIETASGGVWCFAAPETPQ